MSMRPNKKGIELAVNFLVMLIIGIVVFGLALKLLYDVVSQVEDITKLTQEELTQRVGFLTCRGDQVCFDRNVIAVKRGKISVFGMKIRNVNDKNALFRITADKNSGVNAATLDYSKLTVWPVVLDSVSLNPNEEEIIAIGVVTDKDTMPGKYVVNVFVETCYRDLSRCNVDGWEQYKDPVYKFTVVV